MYHISYDISYMIWYIISIKMMIWRWETFQLFGTSPDVTLHSSPENYTNTTYTHPLWWWWIIDPFLGRKQPGQLNPSPWPISPFNDAADDDDDDDDDDGDDDDGNLDSCKCYFWGDIVDATQTFLSSIACRKIKSCQAQNVGSSESLKLILMMRMRVRKRKNTTHIGQEIGWG